MGVNPSTVAVSPRSAAAITRLKSRSNRSRGDIRLMSGAGPAGSGPAPSGAEAATPGFAMSGTAGAGASRATFQTIAPTRTRATAPPVSQATRSERPPSPAPPARPGPPAAPAPGPGSTGRPQRWQNRARAESRAPQWAQPRGTRLAPQVLQKFPSARAPQAGQEVDGGGDVMRPES